MKATLERHVKTMDSEILKNFNFFLSHISCSENENDLRQSLKYFYIHPFFKFGFGNNHLWLSEAKTGDRILIVNFQ